MDDVSEELMRIEREARRDQASAEAEAAQLYQARRTLVEFCWEAAQAGHRLNVSWVGGDVTGDPVRAVGDLLVLAVGEDRLAINLASVVAVSDEGASGTVTPVAPSDPGSFAAWCRMVERVPATILLVGGVSLRGAIVAVAPDHLLIRNSSDTAVALSAVVGVRVAAGRLFGF